jgi:hypothetical protein
MDNQDEVDALKAMVRELQGRIDTFKGLDERVRVAEARALEAERRLQELTDQVSATGAERSASTAEGNDLRARLARTASKKKPGGRGFP